MYRKYSILLLTSSMLIAGCTAKQQGTQNAANPDTAPPHRGGSSEQMHKQNKDTGFVHYKKDDLKLMDKEGNAPIELNREKTAHAISKMLLQQDFQEAATLVTDREVLIAYEKNAKLETSDAADIAKKTAESIMPRYYHIYVSDEPNRMQDIESLHNAKTTENIRTSVDKIIAEMEQDREGKNH